MDKLQVLWTWEMSVSITDHDKEFILGIYTDDDVPPPISFEQGLRSGKDRAVQPSVNCWPSTEVILLIHSFFESHFSYERRANQGPKTGQWRMLQQHGVSDHATQESLTWTKLDLDDVDYRWPNRNEQVGLHLFHSEIKWMYLCFLADRDD